MTRIGYHASHEQFAPSELVSYVKTAESSGFDCAKCSDHFHPWSERQGQSGFAWSWLGAAMQATDMDYGIISAPGYRYHPAILAQAAATIAEMFPDRLWLALGSGEAINEAITGQTWPDKPERNARLRECVDIIRALFAGETVTWRGRVTIVEGRLYTRPRRPVPLFGAAVTEATAAFAGTWADGLLTTGGNPSAVRKVLDAFRANGGEGKPIHVQHALSWASSEEQALQAALDQWSSAAVGGEVAWDLRRPSDFDRLAPFVGPDQIRKCVSISADLAQHEAWLAGIAELGVHTIHLHNVGINQQHFIEAFGRDVLPSLAAQ